MSRKKLIARRYAMLEDMPCLIGQQWPSEAVYCGGRLENNHLNSIAKRTRDDLRTIRMCYFHHQAQSPLPVGMAYHKGKKSFFARLDTNDEDLLARQNEVMGWEE